MSDEQGIRVYGAVGDAIVALCGVDPAQRWSVVVPEQIAPDAWRHVSPWQVEQLRALVAQWDANQS